MILSLEAMLLLKLLQLLNVIVRGRSRAAAPSKMKHSRPLTLITKHSILDVAAVVDPTLIVKNDKSLCPNLWTHGQISRGQALSFETDKQKQLPYGFNRLE